MKNFVFRFLFFTLSGGCIALVVLSLLFLPVSTFKKLKNQYVKVEFIDGNAHYQVVAKRPRKWVSLEQMDYTALHAIVVSEDWSFYQHHGIDLEQIRVAFADTLLRGKSLRGASTITQQVVKNLFLTNRKSFWRKTKEAFLAIGLEIALSKEKILEIYLNIIEYGDTVYGIYDASKYYFGKLPSELSTREGAFLANVLPAPKRYSHSFENGDLSVDVSKSIDYLLRKMVMAKYISRHQMNTELVERLDWEDPSYLSDIVTL